MKRQKEDSEIHKSSAKSRETAESEGPSNTKIEKRGRPAAESWSIGGLNGLRPVSKTVHFTLDLNVFNDLVEATYRHLCDANPCYPSYISMGMFSYYCGVVLWYRLFAVRYAQGADKCSSLQGLKASISRMPILPKSIAKFLDVIGDFHEPTNSLYWKLVTSDFNADGHFGRMSANTFSEYMAYPAPAVLIAALRRELDTIDMGGLHSKWKLKEIDYEGCPNDRAFTTNVCGYYVPPAISHSDIRIGLYMNIFIALTEIKESCRSKENHWWVSTSLMRYITNYHKKEFIGYPMKKYGNESRYGCPVQMGFVEFPQNNGNGDDTSHTVQGFSPSTIPDGKAILIPVFRLRVKRASVVDAYPYDFPTINDVPADWAEKLNTKFNYGDAGKRWNLGVYTTGSVDGKVAVADYVRKFLKD